MMIKNFLYLVLPALLLFFCSCSQKTHKNETTGVKIFNATQNEIHFSLKGASGYQEAFSVAQLDATDYITLQPDTYEFDIAKNKRSLINKEFSLTGNEKYTLIIYGKPEYSSEVNDATFNHKLHYIFEGAENYAPNAFMPGILIFRDSIKLKKSTSALRAFHAAPELTSISIKVKDKKSVLNLAKALKYGKPVLSKHIKSGRKTIEVFLAGASEPILSKDYNFQSQKSYVLVIENGAEKPALQILAN